MNFEQQAALDQIFTNKEPLLILGHAGTGKTYLAIHAILDMVQKNKKVAVNCPTHQAKQQFLSKLPLRIIEKINVSTVASFMLQYPTKQMTGELIFRKGSLGKNLEYDFIFVDEASMVSEYEMSEYMKCGTKVIFLGDMAQLLPVMKKQGNLWQTVKTITLTQQHRNAGHILSLASRARDNLIYPIASKSDGSIIVHPDRASLIDDIISKLKNSSTPYDNCYLAYRNKTVDEARAKIHKELYGDEPFLSGQYLRLDQTLMNGENFIGNNGSLLMVTNAVKSSITIYGDVIEFYTCSVVNVFSGVFGNSKFVDPSTQNYIKNKMVSLIHDSRDAFFEKRMDDLEILQDELTFWRKTFVFTSSPYAQTVHKSQGKSIPNVYVDSDDISSGSSRKRLFYVAYSRAMNTLNVIKKTI